MLQEIAGKPALVGHCKRQLVSDGHAWVNAISLPDHLVLPDVSQRPKWKQFVDPEKQLSQKASSLHRRKGDRIIAVSGHFSYQVNAEDARCRDAACTADVQFPPADLFEITGDRELN